MSNEPYYKLLYDILNGYNRFTPNRITHLRTGQIFVFGTDNNGSQRFGAAGLAAKRFGARIGQNEGLMGSSYAIPSMGVGLDRLASAVETFEYYARKVNNSTFLVTPIGCGHAGFKVSQVAPYFIGCVGLSNVYLPTQFIKYYTKLCTLNLNLDANTTENRKDNGDEEVYAYYDKEVYPVINFLLSHKIAFNKDGGFSLLKDGTVLAEAELGIESQKIVLYPFSEMDKDAFEHAGYTVMDTMTYLKKYQK